MMPRRVAVKIRDAENRCRGAGGRDAEITRAVRGSDYSPAIALSEGKDKLV